MIGHPITSNEYDNIKNMLAAEYSFPDICESAKISIETLNYIAISDSFETYKKKRCGKKSNRDKSRKTGHSHRLNAADFDFVKSCLSRGMKKAHIALSIGKSDSTIGLIDSSSTFEEYSKITMDRIGLIQQDNGSKDRGLNTMFDLIAGLEKRIRKLEMGQ